MTYTNIRNTSFLVSLGLHILLLIIFFFIKLSLDYPPRDYVELGFGNMGESGSAGAAGTQIEDIQQSASLPEQPQVTESSREVKEVELPKTKNTEDENVITRADKSREEKKEQEKIEKTSDSNPNSTVSNPGKGNKGTGEGSFGFDLDFGGRGSRRIYSYRLPDYPDGVSKEIDVKLKFTILPDGTVGTIFPLIKADSRLEYAAINSLRQWRFEPVPSGQKQIEQTAIIVFPYRLR